MLSPAKLHSNAGSGGRGAPRTWSVGRSVCRSPRTASRPSSRPRPLPPLFPASFSCEGAGGSLALVSDSLFPGPQLEAFYMSRRAAARGRPSLRYLRLTRSGRIPAARARGKAGSQQRHPPSRQPSDGRKEGHGLSPGFQLQKSCVEPAFCHDHHRVRSIGNSSWLCKLRAFTQVTTF